GVERELAAELLDRDALDDIHADAAAAGLGHRVASREPGRGQDVEQLLVAGDLAMGASRDRFAVDAAAIVADRQLELLASELGTRDPDRARARLAGGLPDLGRLDRVIDGVAHEVDQRGQQPIGDGLVELGIADVELEPDLLVTGPRDAADEQRERLEHLGDADHANAKDRAAQVAELARLEIRDLAQLADVDAARRLSGELALEPEPRHDQRRELLLELVEPA